jgi:hypothetical protein
MRQELPQTILAELPVDVSVNLGWALKLIERIIRQLFRRTPGFGS